MQNLIVSTTVSLAIAAFLDVLETHRGFGGEILFRTLNFGTEDKPSQLLLCGEYVLPGCSKTNQTKSRLKILIL